MPGDVSPASLVVLFLYILAFALLVALMLLLPRARLLARGKKAG